MVKTWTIDEVSNNRTVNDKVIPLTDAERQQLVIDWNNAEQKKSDDKIVDIRNIRNQKLSETDYLANSDITMPANIKTWRQTLRDIPQDHTTEAAYDLLLARDGDGNLTHSVWTKP